MKREDRELLAQAAQVNQKLGDVVLVLMEHSTDGELPASGLRTLANHLVELAEMLQERADDLENVVEGPPLPAMGPGEDPGEDEGPTTICRRPPGALPEL